MRTSKWIVLLAAMTFPVGVPGARAAGSQPTSGRRPSSTCRMRSTRRPVLADVADALRADDARFLVTEGGFFYSANSFCAPEHGGTHLDAPIHFARGRRTADQIPVRPAHRAGVVIDVSKAAAADPDYRLSVADVRVWGKSRTIPGGAIVLLRTGWSARWPDRKRYLGDDTPGDASNLHFPSFGPEAVAVLVRDRRVGALGVDTASIDPGTSKTFRCTASPPTRTSRVSRT